MLRHIALGTSCLSGVSYDRVHLAEELMAAEAEKAAHILINFFQTSRLDRYGTSTEKATGTVLRWE